MNSGARVALGVGAGYVLGRTRKMRLALMLAAVGANGRLGGGPRQLLQQGVAKIGSSGEVRELTESVRGDLLSAAKAAAMTAATSRIDGLTDRLQAGPQQPHEEAEPQQESEPSGKAERQDADDAEDAQDADDAEDAQDADDAEGAKQKERSRTGTRTRTTRRETTPPTRRAAGTSEENRSSAPRRRGTAATSSGRPPVRRTRR